jgi:hypothetical protein
MPVIGPKAKSIRLTLVLALGLFAAACGPISIGEKPIEKLSPEEAAERVASEARDKAWEIQSQPIIDLDAETDVSFVYQKGGGPSESGGLGSLFLDQGNSSSGSEFVGGIGVNSYLWRATLDTVSFMPLSSADPFGGVILTDWHATPDAPGERFKLNIRILGRGLRADGINVSTFRQIQDRTGSWINAGIPTATNEKIENAILFKARELRHRAVRK